jgi:hypothetical protein
VPAAALPPAYLDEVIAENEVKLPVQGHRRRHIGKESPKAWHKRFLPGWYII